MLDQLTEEDAVGEGTGPMEVQGPGASLSFSGKEADFLDVLPAQGLGRGPGNGRAETGHFSLVAAPPGRSPPGGGGAGPPPGAPVLLLSMAACGQGESF